MIQITNTNNQLRIVDSGRIELYKFEEITNVAWNRSAENKHYVLITFDSEYLLRIELARVDNQVTWTDSLAGAQAAVEDISLWMDTAISDITAILTAIEADTTAIETNTTGVARTPGIIRPTIAGDVSSAAATFYSVSVANVGLANGTVLGAVIKPGEVLNFSADALNNYFTKLDYDATGTEFVIIFVY